LRSSDSNKFTYLLTSLTQSSQAQLESEAPWVDGGDASRRRLGDEL